MSTPMPIPIISFVLFLVSSLLFILFGDHKADEDITAQQHTDHEKEHTFSKSSSETNNYQMPVHEIQYIQDKTQEMQNALNVTCNNREFIPDFNPERFNDIEYIEHNNCMAYAFLDRTESRNRIGKPQPGEHVGLAPLDINDYTCENFQQRLMLDYPGIKFTQNRNHCPCGYYKAALVLDIKNGDYHFYRQDSSMLWSHKPGSLPVTNVDAGGKYILDPQDANRDYSHMYDNEYGYNYVKFCSYICIPSTINSRKNEVLHNNQTKYHEWIRDQIDTAYVAPY
jgi:hypothetical protein